MILRFVLLLLAALPAIWSHNPERQRAAFEVLRILSVSLSNTIFQWPGKRDQGTAEKEILVSGHRKTERRI
jgi:hypothetical protein